MTSWSFLTARLRGIAGSLGITGRNAHGVVSDLTAAGYVAKQRRPPQPLPGPGPPPAARTRRPGTRHRRVLALVAGAGARLPLTGTGPG
jgi:hypothetical protein